RGNRIGAAGAALAPAIVLLATECAGANLAIVLVTIAAGAVVSVPAARRVAITDMPQLVAIFNGIGGGAAALIGLIELTQHEVLGVQGGAMAGAGIATGIAIGSLTPGGPPVTFLEPPVAVTGA